MINGQSTNQKKHKSNFRWFIWWKISQEEIEEQVAEYQSLKITKTPRGQSLLLLIFTFLATIIFVIFFKWGNINLIQAFVFLILGYFIYRGHQWAMIGAMILWTIEKACMVYGWFEGPSDSSSGNPLIHLLWWAIYMHAFYFALRVERLRNKIITQTLKQSSGAFKVESLDDLEKLAQFKDKGIITEDEYNRKKKQILGL